MIDRNSQKEKSYVYWKKEACCHIIFKFFFLAKFICWEYNYYNTEFLVKIDYFPSKCY